MHPVQSLNLRPKPFLLYFVTYFCKFGHNNNNKKYAYGEKAPLHTVSKRDGQKENIISRIGFLALKS